MRGSSNEIDLVSALWEHPQAYLYQSQKAINSATYGILWIVRGQRRINFNDPWEIKFTLVQTWFKRNENQWQLSDIPVP